VTVHLGPAEFVHLKEIQGTRTRPAATSPPSGDFGSRYGKNPELKWAVVSVTRTSLVWSASQSNSERADRASNSLRPLSRSATLQEGGLPSYEQLHQPAMLSSTTTGEFADGPRPA
jgi:hypothetical protein